MLRTGILSLFALFLLPKILNSQTIYLFEYSQKVQGSVVSKKAFFLMKPDGSGFLRVRYNTPDQGDLLLGYNLNLQSIQTAEQIEDTSQVLIQAINPELFIGDPKADRTGPVFLFEKKTGKNYFEPKGIVLSEKPLTLNEESMFAATEIEHPEKSIQILKHFFSEDDPYMALYLDPESTKGTTEASSSVKFHLIIVADTTEQVIGKSCAKDYYRTYFMYKDLADYLGCQFQFVGLAGSTFSKASVVSQLKLLNPGSNDIVIFYYSGHGFRKDGGSSRYPNLDLRSKNGQSFLVESLSTEDIYKAIVKKNARLNLVMTDCCNNYVGDGKVNSVAPFATKSMPRPYHSNNVKTLFLDPKYSILAIAADSTQKATSNDNYGGFFSYFYESSLMTTCTDPSEVPSWDDIFKQTIYQTVYKANHTYCDKPYIESNICRQNPVYRINPDIK